jgi:hypothetical protein
MKNHTYYLTDDKSKIVGYIKAGTKEFIALKPKNFDSRYRKFVEVKGLKTSPDDFYFPKKAEDKPLADAKVWRLAGSKGDTHTVTDEGNGLYCSCKGFQFRNKCKHVDEIKSKELADAPV